MKYFDGTVNETERLQLMQHLKTCEKCSNEFDSLKDIFNCLEEEDNHIEPPANFEEQVMAKVNLYEADRRKKVDGFLMLIYGVQFDFGVFQVYICCNVKGQVFLESLPV
jgi:anti-sigma factor RsiW